MSYVVLARKYRPPDFEGLVGQEHVVQALANALTQQRLHHAYLFTGTRGVGKTTVSRILAKSLNCVGPDGQGGITAHPCGACDPCRDIDAGRFIDYVELDAASNRGVEEISQLLDQSVYKPVTGRFKVYMIDEVHMLSTTAFNAMLKTLEEPPEYLKFVLATTDPQKVPATVLSRCLQFNLRPMAPQTVQQHLGAVLEREQIPADAGALRLLARAARGSMRDALSLTDQAIAYGAGRLDEEGVRRILGAVDRGHAVRMLEALAAADGAALVAAVDQLRGLGLSAGGALEELAALTQQIALAQAVPDALDESDPDTDAARRLASVYAPDETQLIYSLALHGRAELALAPDDYSGLVMVLLRMLAFRPQGGASAQRPARASGPSTSVANAGQAASASAPAPIGSAASGGSPKAMSAPAPAPAPSQATAPAPASAPLRAAGAAPAVAAVAAPRAAAPAARARADEPPPWMDEAPAFDDDGPAPIASPPVRRAAPANGPAGPVPSSTLESTPRAATEFVATPLGARWAELVAQMNAAGSISAFARELAMQAECVALDERATPVRCVLRVERETLRASAPCDKLQAALSGLLGRPVALAVEAGAAQDSPARRDALERERRQAQAEQIIHDDPLVRALMAQYKTARIVPGSIKPQ